jgi:hypothetical protein
MEIKLKTEHKNEYYFKGGVRKCIGNLKPIVSVYTNLNDSANKEIYTDDFIIFNGVTHKVGFYNGAFGIYNYYTGSSDGDINATFISFFSLIDRNLIFVEQGKMLNVFLHE